MGKKENWLKQMKRIIKSPSPDSTRKLTADVLVSPAQGKQEPINLNVNTKISAGIGIKCDNGVEDEDVADSRLPPPGKSRGENGESHALAIAKATAVATEAAAAAAQAAAEVVRLSNGRPNIGGTLEDFAAVKIQAAFRGHLAKQALRALKGLVKLQAVIRGYCVRRQARMTLRCMQTLIRLQDRVRSRQLRLTMDEHPLTVGVPPSMSPNFSGHNSKNNIVQSYSRGFQPNMQPTRKTIKYCRENNYNNDSDLRYALAQGQPAGNSPWIGKVSR